jgi:transposase
MLIIGCDYHPSFQQIACVDTDTGELSEHRLAHREEAEAFYRVLRQRNLSVRVGMESSGHSRWFERLLHELGFELWIGDPAEIQTRRVRKQKTDRQDAQLMLRLMIENRFPRIWVPDAENRDLRQLLWHRHRLVQMRTRVMNQLHVVPLNEGLRRKKALWRPAGRKELESIALAPWASRRRQDLLDLLDQLTPKIQDLTRALEEEVEKRPVIGTPERFHCGKQLASYVGLVPEEKSSGDRRRQGHISKQGNVLLRFLLVEAAQVTVRSQQEWRSKFFHLAMRRGRKIAKVAMARKLAVHLYWMWRQGLDYGQTQKLGSHAGEPGHLDGVQSNTDVMIGHPAPSK